MTSCEAMARRANDSPENEEAQSQEKSHPPHPPNHIFISSKTAPMNSATFALLQLTQFDEVVIRARGAAISRAVDVAQIVTKRLGKDLFKVKSIRISTEVMGEGGEARNISAIEIVVGK